MNCATFESELTLLMAGEIPESERAALIGRLSAHADECPECSGATDLLVLMAQPSGERDLASDPGPAYWASFDQRLADRLGAEGDAPGKPARVDEPGSLRSYAAAALALLLAGGLWWSFRPGSESRDLTRLIAENVAAVDDLAPPLELPADLESLLDALPAETTASALGGFSDPIDDWSVEPFEPAADDTFHEWWAALDDRARALLLDDWLPGDDAPAATDPGPSFGLALFPDASNLDGAQRKELLQWLNEQV